MNQLNDTPLEIKRKREMLQKVESSPLKVPLSGITTQARARNTDPESSHIAANAANTGIKAEIQQDQIVQFVVSQGTKGANSAEIAKATGIEWQDVGRQVKPCITSGRLRRSALPNGKQLHRRGVTPSGRTQELVLNFDACLSDTDLNPELELFE
jgi:hypothetical protein